MKVQSILHTGYAKKNVGTNMSFAGHSRFINLKKYGTNEGDPLYFAISDRGYANSKDMDSSIRSAITKSSDYDGGFILAGDKPANYFADSNFGKANVYFSDKGETVYQDTFKRYNYVVISDGSTISEYDNEDAVPKASTPTNPKSQSVDEWYF